MNLSFVYPAVGADHDPELADHRLKGQTQLAAETSHLMKLGDISQRHTAGRPRLQSWVADIGACPPSTSPRCATSRHTLVRTQRWSHCQRMSEPTWSDGAVQLFAADDRGAREFEEIALAWEEQNVLERLAELIAGDCSVHEAVDWVVVEEAERYTVGQWARVRDVTEDAVGSDINSTREQLLAEEDREH